jgi:hypothetical protein
MRAQSVSIAAVSIVTARAGLKQSLSWSLKNSPRRAEAVSKDFGSFLGQTGLDGIWNCGAVGRLARMKRFAVAGGGSTQWRRRVIL